MHIQKQNQTSNKIVNDILMKRTESHWIIVLLAKHNFMIEFQRLVRQVTVLFDK